MTLFQPSVLKGFLSEIKARPKKALSQNFLTDGNILRKIVAAADTNSKDLILEIGPGPGVLTEGLLKSGASVLAVEKDEKFAQALNRFNTPSLQCLSTDFLAIDTEKELKKRLPPGLKAKVISNIPYHLTGIILQRLLPLSEAISSLTLLVQEEVAQRCVSLPKTKSFSSFTLFTHYYSTPKLLFKVEPSCFFPQPKVRSAVVQFSLKKPTYNIDSSYFFQITKAAFTKRRKMLRSSLKSIYSPEIVENELKKLGLKTTSRPEELSLDLFLKFARALKKEAKNTPSH